jgi:hypothetical protein
MRASKLQPALLGGVVIGVLSALPVISAGNCLCCLWVILGGILATYLLQQAQPTPVEAADGAIVGLLAGVVGAVVGTVVSIPIQMLMGPMGSEALRRILEQSGGDMPAEVRDVFEQMSRGGVGGALMFVGLLMSLVVNAIFGAIGGALGTTLFKPSMPPPPPVPGFADSSRPHTPE